MKFPISIAATKLGSEKQQCITITPSAKTRLLTIQPSAIGFRRSQNTIRRNHPQKACIMTSEIGNHSGIQIAFVGHHVRVTVDGTVRSIADTAEVFLVIKVQLGSLQ